MREIGVRIAVSYEAVDLDEANFEAPLTDKRILPQVDGVIAEYIAAAADCRFAGDLNNQVLVQAVVKINEILADKGIPASILSIEFKASA